MKPVEIVKEYFHSLETGNFEKLGSLLADDIIWNQPGHGPLSKKYQGKNEVFALFGKFMEISEGTFKIDSVDHIMDNRNTVAATLNFSAQKKSGQKISMKGVDIMTIEAGKIKEVYLYSSDQKAEDHFWTP